MVEEFTITTKRLLGYTVKAELALHALLLLDRLPLWCLALGAGAHLLYARLLRRFPYMDLTSPDVLAAAAALAASAGAWAWHFHKSYYSVEYIAAFLVVTTLLVPFGLFISMAGEQAVLPGAGGFPYTSPSPSPTRVPGGMGGGGGGGMGGGGGGGGGRQEKRRRGVALRLFDVLRRKRDEVIPGMMSHLPASAGLIKESIA